MFIFAPRLQDHPISGSDLRINFIINIKIAINKSNKDDHQWDEYPNCTKKIILQLSTAMPHKLDKAELYDDDKFQY